MSVRLMQLPSLGLGKLESNSASIPSLNTPPLPMTNARNSPTIVIVVKPKVRDATDASVDNYFKNYIVSLLAASDPKKKVSFGAQASSATVDPPSAPPAITLNSILGRLKK
jgi:hypothetical protein